MNTYSFIDFVCSLFGPTGTCDLGYGSAAAEEGISVEMIEDKNTMTIGADGEGMHSLHAGKAGTVTVRLLKTSPQNAKLQAMYDAQTASSTLHGQNVIVARHTKSNDVVTCRSCAFKKAPPYKYAKEGDIVEWVFDSLKVDGIRGTY